MASNCQTLADNELIAKTGNKKGVRIFFDQLVNANIIIRDTVRGQYECAGITFNGKKFWLDCYTSFIVHSQQSNAEIDIIGQLTQMLRLISCAYFSYATK